MKCQYLIFLERACIANESILRGGVRAEGDECLATIILHVVKEVCHEMDFRKFPVKSFQDLGTPLCHVF